MKKFPLLSFSTFLVALILSSCNVDANENGNNESVSINIDDEDGKNISINIENKEDLKEALNEVEKALKNIDIDINVENENGEVSEPIASKDLKKILPKRIGWIKQTDSSAESGGAFGLNVASAKATYEDDDQKIEIAIVDGGGLGSLFSKISDWAKVEVDKTTHNGG